MKLLYFLLFALHCGSSKKVDQILTIERFFNCPDRVAKNPNFDKEYNYIGNITYKKYKLSQVTNGNMFINTYVKKLPTNVILKRCQSEHDTTCENFIKMKFNDLCPLMLEKGQVHTPFAEAFHPPIRCPLVKGTQFTITNATIDTEGALKTLKYVPNIYSYYWGLRFEGKSNNVEIWCMELWFRLYEIKGH